MSMIPIPNYLKEYASTSSQKGNELSFILRCTCGCEDFYVLENIFTKDEKALVNEYEKNVPNIRWHSIYGELDSNGKPYNYIKILGLFKKRIVFPQAPVFMKVNVIKGICSHCQQEVVLFDSRYHGYDGMTSNDEEVRKYTPVFKQVDNKTYGVIVAIENEQTLESFNEIISEQCSYEFYSNSFISISIYTKEEYGKKRILYSFETA